MTIDWGDPDARNRLIERVGPDEYNRGDRVTALIEDIWCEKIRGCSDRGGNTSA